jgi:hypothetical protein
MKLLHEKSKCCGAKIIRFGGKRRRCVACGTTWRVHPARRGRKAVRRQRGYLNKVFSHNFSVKQLAVHSSLSAGAIYKRFTKNLNAAIRQERIVRIRGSKLILIIDAEWQYFKGELWTMYFLSAKSTNSQTVTIFDPAIRRGRENSTTWNEIINQLPPDIKKRVIALVSDGIRGIETISSTNGWITQRCHFHILSMLQGMRGKRALTPGRLIRDKIYCSVKLALTTRSKRKLNALCRRLAILAKDAGCPTRMRFTVRGFLKQLAGFRSYLEYPEFNLPTTINVMESINSFAREKTKTLNSPKSWHRWAIACIRFKSKFTCK